jgi:uncharacterized protein
VFLGQKSRGNYEVFMLNLSNLSNIVNTLQPLVGGVLIGLASWLLLASLGRVAGISGIASSWLVSKGSSNVWRAVFLVGLMAGGWVAAQLMAVPITPMRPAWLLCIAGVLVGFGTVLGSGCTSGHGVCGLGRRSLRSLLATLTFMLAGFATVFCVNYVNFLGFL